MPTRPDSEELAAALGARLDGVVHDLRRLSGGASRVTSSFDLARGESRRPLILQMDRGDSPAKAGLVQVERALLGAAASAGVPVPAVVADGDGSNDGLGAAWLVVERLEGETIPRKILRDAAWAAARRVLTAQCGQAVAAIHTIDPGTIAGLPPADPLGDPLPYLDLLGEARPALELGARWLQAQGRVAASAVTVHGDFRLGNLLVGPDGLRGVLDWELAHVGDPAEDIGWLCAPAWRFGGPGEVGGFGALDDLLVAYRGGRRRVDGPRPRPLVAGLRHGEMGHHLRPPGLGAPERRHPLGGAGGHRPARLRERMGPLCPVGGGAIRAGPGRRGGAHRRCDHRGRRPSAARRPPSWSRRCASTSRPPSWRRARGARVSRRAWPATRSGSSDASSRRGRPSPPPTPRG